MRIGSGELAGIALLRRFFLACAVALAVSACGGPDTDQATLDPDAQRARDDNVIKLDLNRGLVDEGLGAFKDVSAVVYDSRVLLIGSVEEQSSVESAGNLAKGIDGVREVINEIQVGSDEGIGAFISDVIIEKSIQSNLLFDDAIDSDHFRVRVLNGVVYVIGRAVNQTEFDLVSAAAHEPDDVRRVVNYIEFSSN